MAFYRSILGQKNKLYLIKSGKLVNGSTERIYNALDQYKWSIAEKSGYRYLEGHGYGNNYYVLSNPSIHNYERLHLICTGYFAFNLSGGGNLNTLSSFLQQSTNKIDFGRACTLPNVSSNAELELILSLDGNTNHAVIMGGCLGRTNHANNQTAYLKLIDMWIE